MKKEKVSLMHVLLSPQNCSFHQEVSTWYVLGAWFGGQPSGLVDLHL